MIIRRAERTDLEHLVYLGMRFILATRAYSSLMRPDPERLWVLLSTALDMGTILVAELEGEVVGGIAYVILPNPISGDLTADEIAWFVAPEHRGSTVGPRLLVAGENWCAANGATTIKMIAPAGSDVGAFYERRGYVAVETAYAKQVSDGMVNTVRVDEGPRPDREDRTIGRAADLARDAHRARAVDRRRSRRARAHDTSDRSPDSPAADRDEPVRQPGRRSR